MRILYVNFMHWSITGGGTLHPRELGRRLSSRHAVRFASHLESFGQDWLAGTATTFDAAARDRVLREEGLEAHILGLGPVARLLAFPIMRSSRLFALRPRAFRMAFGAGLRALVAGSDIVHIIPLCRGLFASVAFEEARRRGLPVVITPLVHQTGGAINETILGIARSARAVIALTRSERELLEARGVEASRIRVIGYGPLLSTSPRTGFLRERLGPSAPIVLFLGRKTRYKGAHLLLEAAPLVWGSRPDTVFVLAGPDTGFSPGLRSKAAERFVVLGELSEEEKAGALTDCDALCVPSSEESLGGVYIEAWAMGKPFIGLDIPPVKELAGGGERGLAVKPAKEDLAAAILTLVNDPELARRMGRAGRQAASEQYSWDRIAGAMEDLYGELLLL